MRRWLVAVGVVVIALGAMASILPREVNTHTELRDQPVPNTGWNISPVTSLSAGLRFNLSWVSNRPLTIGLATAQAVVSYQDGIAKDLVLTVFDTGTRGRFGITLSEGGNYAVATRYESGSGLLNITMDLHLYQPNGYLLYGAGAIVAGSVLLYVGVRTFPRPLRLASEEPVRDP
jgi:hypothetical protein